MGSKFLFPCCFLLLAQCKPYCPEIYFKDQEWSRYFSMVSTGKQILMEKLFDLSVCGFFFFLPMKIVWLVLFSLLIKSLLSMCSERQGSTVANPLTRRPAV